MPGKTGKLLAEAKQPIGGSTKLLSSPMRILIVSPVRLFGDGLAEYLNCRPEILVETVVPDLFALRKKLSTISADIVLIDITQALDFEEIRAFAAEWPNVNLVALGMEGQRRDVARRGRPFFTGFAGRDGTGDELSNAIVNALANRSTSSAESFPGLLRRWFARMRRPLTQAEKAP
jgi:two-component system nitrate/nitrite response regulator NarL